MKKETKIFMSMDYKPFLLFFVGGIILIILSFIVLKPDTFFGTIFGLGGLILMGFPIYYDYRVKKRNKIFTHKD